MRSLLITVNVAYFLCGGLYGHDIIYDPEPMILTLGGRDGTISIVLVGDEPSPNCMVSACLRRENR